MIHEELCAMGGGKGLVWVPVTRPGTRLWSGRDVPEKKCHPDYKLVFIHYFVTCSYYILLEYQFGP
jgi:hypothetical protein